MFPSSDCLLYNAAVDGEEFRRHLVELGIAPDGIEAMLGAFSAKTVQECAERNGEPIPDEAQAEDTARILRARFVRRQTLEAKGGMEWGDATDLFGF